LTQWLRKYPDDFVARFTLADIHMQKGDHPSAKNEFAILVKAQPNNLVVLNNLAWLLMKTDPAQALRYAEYAASLQPAAVEIQDTLGLVLLEQGQVQRALRILETASNKSPNSLNLKFHLAKACAKNGETARARTILQDILSKPDQFPERAEAEAFLKTL